MFRSYFIFYVFFILAFGYWCSASFRQERAKIRYTNPKYIKDVVVFTFRKSRNDPYLTNMTGTLLMPYGNNVTNIVTISLISGGDFRLSAKVCDTVKNKWMRDFMSQFTNLTLDECPFAAGTYRYKNMELPPKNIPVPLPEGDLYIKYELVITATKEKIFEMATLLHYDNTRRKKKN